MRKRERETRKHLSRYQAHISSSPPAIAMNYCQGWVYPVTEFLRCFYLYSWPWYVCKFSYDSPNYIIFTIIFVLFYVLFLFHFMWNNICVYIRLYLKRPCMTDNWTRKWNIQENGERALLSTGIFQRGKMC